MKKITSEWLKSIGACEEGIEWIESLDTDNPVEIIKIAIKSKDRALLDYCNWGIVRLLSRKDRIRYSVYAAELALPKWEAEYPNDDRPRKAIQAAKEVIKRDSERNRDAAYAAAQAAYDSACEAAFSAACTAYSAHSVAAARAAYSTAYSAFSAAYAARAACAAYSADYASEEYAKTLIKCLKYGIKLLEAK